MKRIFAALLALALTMGFALAEDAENDELAAIGAELLARARAQLADEAYGEMFLSDGDALALRAQWAASMEDDGVRPAIYPRPRLSSLYEMALASDGGAPDLDGEVMDVLEEAAVSMLASILLGNMGVKYITAAATFNLQDFYALPDGFSDCVLVYGFSDVSLLIECTREEAGEAEFLYARAYLSAPEAGSMLAGMAALEEVAATGE